MSSRIFIVVAPTFYSNTEDVRYLLGLEACRQAVKYEIKLILIDASPSNDVKLGLEHAGTRTLDNGEQQKFVTVIPQKIKGKKGVALREGIVEAIQKSNDISSGNADSIVAFQELEKVDMFRHWGSIIDYMIKEGSDICVAKRREAEFQNNYPIEQYHSEMFANYMLNSLGSQLNLTPIDWTAGPIAFRTTQAHHWLKYTGDLWDAQLVPLLDSHLAGAKVSSCVIGYRHPEEMKDMEQGAALWNEKRLYQLNVLSDTVGKRMKEALKNFVK